MGIFWRWFGAFVLLAATFNPTPWNYVRWALAHYDDQLPLTVFLGLLLTIGYIIYLNATLNSIGGFGMLLVAAVFAALVWVLLDWGVLDLANTDVNLWLGILALSVIMGVGVSWSLVQKRLTGQVDVDEIDER
jgi:hypothetical protein